MNGILRFRFFTFICLTFIGVLSVSAQDLTRGENMFNANCATCHAPDQVSTGPMMGPLKAKYEGDDWVYEWVRQSSTLISSGDERAVAMESTFAGVMNVFPTLSNEVIDDILAYAEAESLKNAAPPEPIDGTGPVVDPGVYYALMGLVGLLALIALLLVIITATLISAVRAKEGHEPFTLTDVKNRSIAILSNKFVATAIATFILVVGGAKLTIEARKVSLHQGYMPEQPIAFSHKLHAGEYQIDCKYCHSGTMKSKNAGIPSANVCMNCHKSIPKGPTGNTEEIAKIYEAVGFDATKGDYDPNKEIVPIEWIRIHNIPDHAYFNHAQHVQVGGIECQTCHGQVEEMEVVYQFAELSMGWCIDCHRTEKVKDLGVANDKNLTVEDLGGLNCSRCHY